MCNTSNHRCPTLPHQEATHYWAMGKTRQPEEHTVPVESGMLAAFPMLGDEFCIHGGGNEETANIKRQRHEVTVMCTILLAPSLLKFPEKPEDTCFQNSNNPVHREKYFSASFFYSFFLCVCVCVGCQSLWSCRPRAKKHILCDLTPSHQHVRWMRGTVTNPCIFFCFQELKKENLSGKKSCTGNMWPNSTSSSYNPTMDQFARAKTLLLKAPAARIFYLSVVSLSQSFPSTQVGFYPYQKFCF